MGKPEWGNRFVCFSCGCKYYDLNRPEPLCPRCGANPKEAVVGARAAPRASRAASAPDEEEGEQDVLDETIDMGFDSGALLDEDEVEVEGEDEEEEDEEY